MSLDQDYKAIREIVGRSHGGGYEKERVLRKFKQQYRESKRYEEATGLRAPALLGAREGSWRKALCCARLISGDFTNWDGWEFRSDYAATCWHEGNARLGLPLWPGGGVDKLLVLAEEGIGDEVLFMSLLPEAIIRVGEITVECDQRLRNLIERRFKIQTVPRLGTLTGISTWLNGTGHGHTAWVLMGDLARLFRRDKSHFPGLPYLRADPVRVLEMEKFRGRIGVSWAGNHGSYHPELMIRATGTSPINLQYNETHPLAEEPGIDLKNDLEGLFALCSVLSKVVTVSTSIAHIAGSVGCPVDVIHAPPNSGGKNDQDILNWKWPEGKTPWYGSARVFRNLKQYEMRR